MSAGAQKPGFRWKPGPGLLTGAADEDPSNIATYSQVGAQFGYALSWTIPVLFPLVAAVQEISARIGRVTGRGLTANLGRSYPKPLVVTLVALLVIANVVNIGADLLAMGSGLSLVVGGPRLVYALLFAVLSVTLEVFIAYDRYARILKWGTLALLSYVATAFSVHVHWGEALRGLWPAVQNHSSYTTALVAIAGTTISPYLFFWQSGQEVEIERASPDEHPLTTAPQEASSELSRIRWDTYVGMGLSQLIAFFILVTAAATLAVHGVRHIDTAVQAAQALRPLAGRFTFWVFSLGLVATGLLSIPALSGACAYAVSELVGWHGGLVSRPQRARGFYAVVALSTLAGALLDLLGINSMKALYLSAVLNGLVAVPLLIMMMLLGHRRDVMGRFALKGGLRYMGWAATVAMAAVGVSLIASWFS